MGAPPHPFDRRWYVHIDGETYGPYTGHEIRQMAGQRQLTESDLVHLDSGLEWRRAADDPILGTLFKSSDTESSSWLRLALDAKAASRLRIGLVSLVLVVAIGWVLWPYYAAYRLAIAVRDGDVSVLESSVAWDRVRQGLRDDLNAVLLRQLSTDSKAKTNEPGAAMGTGLAAVFGPAIVDRIIDSYVTPQGIAAINRTGSTSASPTDIGGAPKDFTETIQSTRQLNWSQVRYAFFSGDPFSFRVEIASEHKAAVQNPVRFLFTWAGNWRLTRIILPVSATDVHPAPTEQSAFKSPSVGAPSDAKSTPLKTPPKSTLNEPAPLTVTLVTKGFKARNIEADDFEDDIIIELLIKNVTDKNIRAFEGIVTFTDLLDNNILSSKIVIDDPVRSGSTLNWKGAIKFNQFVEEHQRLRNEPQANLKMKFAPTKILFADGTSKQY